MEIPAVLSEMIRNTDLDAPTQQIVYDLAVANHDWRSVALLCNLPNLDPSVDTQLRDVDVTEVRVAWLSRAGRPVQQVADMLDGETRQDVLANLADTPYFSDDVYAEIGRRCTSFDAIVAFVTGPAPVITRAEALARLPRGRKTLPRDVTESLHAAVLDSPVLTTTALRHVKRLPLIAYLMQQSSHVDDILADPDTANNVVEVVCIDAFSSVNPRNKAAFDEMVSVTKTAASTLDLLNVALPTREMAATRAEETLSKLIDHSGDSADSGVVAQIRAHIDAIRVEPSDGTTEDALAAQICAGDNPLDAAHELVKLAGKPAHRFAATEAARRVASDPRTAPEVLHVLRASWYRIGQYAADTIHTSDTLRADVDRLVAVACIQSSYTRIAEMLMWAPDQVEAYTKWCEATTARARVKADVVSIMVSMGLPVDNELLEVLPAATLNAAHPFTAKKLTREIGLLLCDHFGASLTQWNLFAEMLEGSPSSVAEVIDVVKFTGDM